jgi:hypothetical protein
MTDRCDSGAAGDSGASDEQAAPAKKKEREPSQADLPIAPTCGSRAAGWPRPRLWAL